MIKDYLFASTDLDAFRNSLANHIGTIASLTDEGSVRLDSTKSRVYYNGNQSVAVVRVRNNQELDLLNSLDAFVQIGEAKAQFIRSIDDIEFIEGGEPLYYSIYDKQPTTFTDEETGETMTHNPPKLHGALA